MAIGRDHLRDVFELHRRGSFEEGSRFGPEHFVERLAHQDLPLLRPIAEARGQIHRMADRGEIAPGVRADRSDHRRTAMDANSKGGHFPSKSGLDFPR